MFLWEVKTSPTHLQRNRRKIFKKEKSYWNVLSYTGRCFFYLYWQNPTFSYSDRGAIRHRVMMDKWTFEAAADVTKVMKCWLAPLTILSILCSQYCVGKLLWWILKMWLFAQQLLFLYVGVKKTLTLSSLGFFFSSTHWLCGYTVGILLKLNSNPSYKAIYSPQIYKSVQMKGLFMRC